MGSGIGLKCSKCHKGYTIITGGGMMFPSVYRELLDDIKKGRYGKEWQDIAQKTPHVAVDAEDYVYSCNKCGAWKIEKGLSLYEPNDQESLKKKQYGIKTVEEWGHVPYVTNYDLVTDYHAVKRYIHKCDKCGGRMHRVKEKEFNNLPCPKCGGNPIKGYNEYICWD